MLLINHKAVQDNNFAEKIASRTENYQLKSETAWCQKSQVTWING